MRLWIVRHAIAMERDDYQLEFGAQATDDLRPLTAVGIRKMELQAKGLKHLLVRPDFLISSPLTRAEETCKILKSIWRLRKTETCAALRPSSRPESFVKWAADHLPNSSAQVESEDLDVVIVGHGPSLPILIRFLVTGDALSEKAAGVELKKGGVCCLEFANKIEAGAGRMKHLLSPRILRALANESKTR